MRCLSNSACFFAIAACGSFSPRAEVELPTINKTISNPGAKIPQGLFDSDFI
jgi:hypothetical protein